MGVKADIELNESFPITYGFYLQDCDGAPVSLANAVTVDLHWRRTDGDGSDDRNVISATVANAATGHVTVAFDPGPHGLRPGKTYYCCFVVDPAPGTTSGRFPDHAPLLMTVYPAM